MSLTIDIRFLTGYCATARSKTDPRPEWPPHPARVYMALAAAYFEREGGDDERDVLRWLESLEPPVLHVPVDATPGEATPTFVPMNDTRAVGRGGSIQSLPSLKRHRAERMFPRTHLPESDDRVSLSWPDVGSQDVERHRPALQRLCDAVARLGHGSSLVQMWLPDNSTPDARRTLVPVEEGRDRLRVVARTSGTLDRLATAFATPPYRPSIKSSQAYAAFVPGMAPPARTVFDERFELLRIEPADTSFRWLSLETTLALAATLRRAVMERCPVQPPPESVSGHAANSSPSLRPHVAFFPLPFVGSEYADGHLLGVAIALPREMTQEDQQALVRSLDAIADDGDRLGEGLGFDRRRFPGLGQWRLVRQGVFDSFRFNLRVDTWTGGTAGTTCWASVTPVVFDHHAKSKEKGAYLDECAARVKDSVAHAVTEANVVHVRITPISPVLGVPPAHDFPRLTRKDGSKRRHAHVEIVFDRPVVGPLLVGAGRYRGYGLCRPISEGSQR